MNDQPIELDEQLQRLEEQFWKGDAAFYRQNLTKDSLMVFAEPVGVLTTDGTVQAIAASPRWEEVQFHDVRVLRLTADAAMVIYRATARRESSSYSARASSAYVRRGDSWKLAFHQQTPAGGD